MTTPLIRYPLDPTGVDPNNAVIGEVTELTNNPMRAFSPRYSPYFGDSLTLWDHASGRQLVRGEDYELAQLEEYPTLRFGKGIYRLVLIVNPDVSNKVRFSYQCLGGLYHLDATGISDLYEAFLNDDRPIAFDKIVGKPLDYPPSMHPHYLSEIHGFEPLITALDRLGDSITLTNTPAFEAILEWVEGRVNEIAEKVGDIETISREDLLSGEGLDKVITYGDLIEASTLLNFNTIILSFAELDMRRGQSQSLDIELTNYRENSLLYWSIEHISTTNSDFEYSSGLITLEKNRASFSFRLVVPEELVEQSEFRVVIRRESPTGPVIKSTRVITARAYDPAVPSDPSEDGVPDGWGNTHSGLGGNGKWTGTIEDYALRMQGCCVFDPYIGINPQSLFIMANK